MSAAHPFQTFRPTSEFASLQTPDTGEEWRMKGLRIDPFTREEACRLSPRLFR